MVNLTEKLKTFAKRGLITTIAAGAIALSACGKEEKDTVYDGNSTPSNLTQCYGATAQLNSGLVSAWQEEGSYGANNLFVHELADSCANAEHCFKNGTPVKDYVLRRQEAIPASVWNAWRSFAGDGKDPRQFTAEDPFIIGYLPHIQRSTFGWKTNHATYDWRCEQGDTGETNGLENCLGLNQLDKNFSLYTLQPGKKYLARFLFGANPNDTGNWIEFCNQTTFEYER